MKKLSFLMIMTLVLGLTACGKADNNADKKDDVTTEVKEETVADAEEIPETDHVMIELSNSEILVNGEKISKDPDAAVYAANDIIFYLENQGIEYGDGKKKDEHSQIEGDAHTVVHITEPGVYELTGIMAVLNSLNVNVREKMALPAELRPYFDEYRKVKQMVGKEGVYTLSPYIFSFE